MQDSALVELQRSRAVPLWLLFVGVVCACAGPPKREYVLGAGAAPATASVVQTALPLIQVERVQVPDYLDTRDILTRDAGQVVASQSGRWAERLSVGVARALTASLATRLSRAVVTSGQPIEPPTLRVLVDVLALEATADGKVVLSARWTITDRTGERSLAAEQANFTQPVAPSGGDGAIVAAMSIALDHLANRIAAACDEKLARRVNSG
jgi:uncharacterized lipoprotein YmbA